VAEFVAEDGRFFLKGEVVAEKVFPFWVGHMLVLEEEFFSGTDIEENIG